MDRKVQIEDFLKDPEFIKWVRMPDDESNQYWESFANANPGLRPAMMKARELAYTMQFKLPQPSAEEKQKVLAGIVNKLNSNEGTARSRTFTIPAALYKSAAAILLLAAALYVFHITQRTHAPEANNISLVKETSSGQKIQTLLPDGTRVWLNAASVIKYTEDPDNNTRNVTLLGEAFFEVHKDSLRPFVVHCNDIAITALGTSFNVRRFENERQTEVALVSGKVSVAKQDKGRNLLILTPGEKATSFDDNPQLLKSGFDFRKEVGWKDGYLVFENAGFDEIKVMLERWYDVKIIAEPEATTNWNYTGEFDNQSLELVLQRISYIKKLDFQINGENVYISKQ